MIHVCMYVCIIAGEKLVYHSAQARGSDPTPLVCFTYIHTSSTITYIHQTYSTLMDPRPFIQTQYLGQCTFLFSNNYTLIYAYIHSSIQPMCLWLRLPHAVSHRLEGEMVIMFTHFPIHINTYIHTYIHTSMTIQVSILGSRGGGHSRASAIHP